MTFQYVTGKAVFNIKDHKTLCMSDSFDYLGSKRRKMPDESWAGIFRDNVRHMLPVELLLPYFSAKTGDPSNQ